MLMFPITVLMVTVMCASTSAGSSSSGGSSGSGHNTGQTDGIHVSRAATCQGVADRQPVRETDTFHLSDDRVYLWCEVMNGAGTTISHVFLQDGEPVTTIELSIGGNRWRTWSAKDLHAQHVGEWSAAIHAEDGTLLYSTTFTVLPGDS